MYFDSRRQLQWIAAIAFIVALASPLAAFAEPFIPRDDDEVLARLPLSAEPVNKEMRELRAALRKAPRTAERAVKLAQLYIKLGKAESDPRYYGNAQAALSPWWRAPEPPSNVLLLRAFIKQNRHDFDGALQDLEQVLARDPSSMQAWLTRAAILRVRASYDQARLSCLPLADSTDPLLAMTCLCDVNSLTGRAQESYDLLQAFLRSHDAASNEQRLWTFTVLAEMAARMGKNAEAESFFKDALALERPSAYLLAAYADFLLDQGRPTETVALLADKTAVDSLLLRFALAKQKLEADDLPEVIAKMRDRFRVNQSRAENLPQGDEARFALYLLGQSEEALRLAKANWLTQREPQDARILLEAALASHDRAAAQPVIDLLAQTGMEHVRLKHLADQLEKLPGR